MAIINNLSASITSFKVNDASKNFQNSGGTYNTSSVLNGGETYDDGTQNILSYSFKINGLLGHTIKSIVVNSLLLDAEGELIESKKFKQVLDGILVNADIAGNINTKVIGNTEFILNKVIEDSIYEFTLELQNMSGQSCYYCLESIIINLSDIKYKINISFSGPVKDRKPSSIVTTSILQNLDAVSITFSKDPTKEFDKELDSIEGRAYFRKDGIYVDGYQYGTVKPADGNKFGVVKLSQDSLKRELNEETELEEIVAPEDSGVVVTTQLLHNVIQEIQSGLISPPIASTEQYGVVLLQNSFNIDEDGGIIAPEGNIAATSQLVFNTLATAKNYTDERISPIQEILDGINAPLIMNIENDEGEKESLGEELTFSNDFEQTDKKLYIKWLEII